MYAHTRCCGNCKARLNHTRFAKLVMSEQIKTPIHNVNAVNTNHKHQFHPSHFSNTLPKLDYGLSCLYLKLPTGRTVCAHTCVLIVVIANGQTNFSSVFWGAGLHSSQCLWPMLCLCLAGGGMPSFPPKWPASVAPPFTPLSSHFKPQDKSISFRLRWKIHPNSHDLDIIQTMCK